jgi:hypothetical protein
MARHYSEGAALPEQARDLFVESGPYESQEQTLTPPFVGSCGVKKAGFPC